MLVGSLGVPVESGRLATLQWRSLQRRQPTFWEPYSNDWAFKRCPQQLKDSGDSTIAGLGLKKHIYIYIHIYICIYIYVHVINSTMVG